VNLYVRAHNRDPFLLASIGSNLTVAGLQLWLGWTYGGLGVAAGYFLGVTLVQSPLLTLIWWRIRRDWH
jgi:O-antigen/teichoic acid export membrane protein